MCQQAKVYQARSNLRIEYLEYIDKELLSMQKEHREDVALDNEILCV